MGGMDIIDKPAVGFEKDKIEMELEDWNREGRQRYLTELITTMVGSDEWGQKTTTASGVRGQCLARFKRCICMSSRI